MASQILNIGPREVWEKRSGLVIIDVRGPDEFEGELGHIPGAKLIVLNTLPQRIEEIPTDKPVVFVCGSGGRSNRAAAFALEHGFDKVYNMEGGMQAWNQLDLEVEGRAE